MIWNRGDSMARSQRGIGIAMSYISVAVGLITTLLYNPLINRVLGMETYGAYSWALSIIQYLSLFQLGLYATFTRFYSRLKARQDKKGLEELNGFFLVTYIFIGIIAFIAGQYLIGMIGHQIAIPSNIDPNEIKSIKFLMHMMVLNICIDFPTFVFQSNIIVREQYIFARSMNIVKQVLSPMIGVPLLLLGVGSASLVFATTCVVLVYQLGCVWFCFKKLHIRFRFAIPKVSFLYEIFSFSFFILLNLIVDQINWSVDKNLLGAFANTIQVGIYTNSDQLSNYFFSFASTIADVYTPKVHRIVAANKPDCMRELTALFVQLGRYQFMLLSLITIGFISVGQVFVRYYASGYIEPYYVAIVLFFSSFISAIQYLGIAILQAKNMHQFKAVLNFTVVFLNIAISIPLIKVFGAFGAALGTFISNIFINGLVINIYYYKKVGLDIPYFWRSIFKLSRGLVLPIIVMFVMAFVIRPKTLGMMVVCGLVIVIVYGVSMLKWGMNRREKQMVFHFIDRLTHRNK